MNIGSKVSYNGQIGTVVSIQKIAYVGTLVHVRFDNGTEGTFNAPQLTVVA